MEVSYTIRPGFCTDWELVTVVELEDALEDDDDVEEDDDAELDIEVVLLPICVDEGDEEETAVDEVEELVVVVVELVVEVLFPRERAAYAPTTITMIMTITTPTSAALAMARLALDFHEDILIC